MEPERKRPRSTRDQSTQTIATGYDTEALPGTCKALPGTCKALPGTTMDDDDTACDAHSETEREMADPDKPNGQYKDESYEEWMQRVDPSGTMREHYGGFLSQCADCGANSGRNQYCGKYRCTSF